MNRYIITKEQVGGREYCISALYDENRRMVEVLPEPEGAASLLGSIYIARVERIVQNLNAAFVKISPEQSCYLALDDLKNPVFTRKLSEKKLLVAGDELLVQVSREAVKTKEPVVTTNLTLTGTYAVVSSGNHKLSVSAKLDANQRTHYLELLRGMEALQGVEGWAYGAIIRTNAAGASDEAVRGEVVLLAEKMMQLLKKGRHSVCYTCLYEEPSIWVRHLCDLRQDMLEEIITDDRGMFEEICAHYGIPAERLVTQGSIPVPVEYIETDRNVKIRHYTDTAVSLSSLYGVKSSL